MDHDPFELRRFVDAQRPVWTRVRQELAAGRKTSHWMWFVFPQLRALGRSATAQRYGIAGLAEARAYAAHPLLGPRLHECAALLLALPGSPSAHGIFGSPDDLKLCSSMTLFEHVAPEIGAYAQVLDRFCGGRRDTRTLELL